MRDKYNVTDLTSKPSISGLAVGSLARDRDVFGDYQSLVLSMFTSRSGGTTDHIKSRVSPPYRRPYNMSFVSARPRRRDSLYKSSNAAGKCIRSPSVTINEMGHG